MDTGAPTNNGQTETCEYDDDGAAYSLTGNGGADSWFCRKCFFFFFFLTHTHTQFCELDCDVLCL